MNVRLILVALFVSAHGASAADWRPLEKIEHYAISGSTGIELYRSIGERGPRLGAGRAIAYTDFKLTWRRDYRPEAGGCTLRSAVPRLIITTRLPKPSGTLPAATRRLWDIFIAGITTHEKVHADGIVEMVRAIEATSVGLMVADDPKCRKIRAELTTRLAALSQEQRRKSREFDQIEMSDGGNVHRLILSLVNGDR
jgi:predicted secreted Zn-dependent protease